MACLPLVGDDNSLDDAELWDFIDSTVARRSTYKLHAKPLLITHHAPIVTELPSSPLCKVQNRQSLCHSDSPSSLKDTSPSARACPLPVYRVDTLSDGSPAGVNQRAWIQPQKKPRCNEEMMVSGACRSHASTRMPLNQIVPLDSNLSSSHEFIEKHRSSKSWPDSCENRLMAGNNMPVSDWMPNVPSAAVFKHIQNAALSVLEKGDYVVMQGKPFIKKCGWRKIAFFFNISFEIKDRTIQFDQNNNVQRAEFVVRANMQSGRFSDGWGSCDRGEKRYSKPNHDIPSTAETRAKTRACQDLLGIGEYKGGTGGWEEESLKKVLFGEGGKGGALQLGEKEGRAKRRLSPVSHASTHSRILEKSIAGIWDLGLNIEVHIDNGVCNRIAIGAFN
ncbi:hypothetical protein GOP47_0008506 [Adiantum capillus-veneris]|uniref:Uncharacterized protein n=1 Tax=Adiantum capillus-veneris TaxID=13818 RepID=A0A9D4UYI6_ADICA|nr:hypothetical protein GOP47_0008506 [Adiantum capillus-veneris]